MKIVRNVRTVTDVMTIRGVTYRFMMEKHPNGMTFVWADQWNGYGWDRRHAWEGFGRPLVPAQGRRFSGADGGQWRRVR